MNWYRERYHQMQANRQTNNGGPLEQRRPAEHERENMGTGIWRAWKSCASGH